MDETISYRDWHIPLSRDDITLEAALRDMRRVGAGQAEIPLMVQLLENPKYDIPGIQLFHGAVDLRQHDCIHIVLGRGLLELDEAFTIGFTMGSTNKVSTAEERLFAFVARYFYPKVYRFGAEAVEVFKDAVKLGYISDCQPLDGVAFDPLMSLSLAEVRQRLGLEADLLRAYYAIERRRYRRAQASRRLLD